MQLYFQPKSIINLCQNMTTLPDKSTVFLFLHGVSFLIGLNMFFVLQLLVKIGVSPSWKPRTNFLNQFFLSLFDILNVFLS